MCNIQFPHFGASYPDATCIVCLTQERKKILDEIQKLIDENYPCDNADQKIGYQYALYKVFNIINLIK